MIVIVESWLELIFEEFFIDFQCNEGRYNVIRIYIEKEK